MEGVSLKVLSCQATNFGSYEELSFNLDNIGLGLIYGPTGSGKSTILDLIAWGLYGITAKDGGVDEVRSWYAEGATEASVVLDTSAGLVKVTRIRGASNENDLYWHEFEHAEEGRLIRGKDLTDTQKLLTKRLGVDSDVFIAGSYCHEFSPTGSFFTAKAKERRALFEKIADLDLPNRLAEGTTAAKKTAKKHSQDLQRQLDKLEGTIEQLLRQQKTNTEDCHYWAEEHMKLINQYTKQAETFDDRKRRALDEIQAKFSRYNFPALQDERDSLLMEIQQIGHTVRDLKDDRCSACNNRLTNNKRIELQDKKELLNERLAKSIKSIEQFNLLVVEQNAVESQVNNFADRVAEELKRVNPHYANDEKLSKHLILAKNVKDITSKALSQENKKLILLDRLYDLSFELRGKLIQNVVESIQNNTNEYLHKHFNAEVTILLSADGADNLDVRIQKNGYECRYKQLSKGQRGLLKLCFSVAVMEATSNKAGIHFETLLFDEPAEGCDNDMKVKSFSLFQELSIKHTSVLVIDHCSEFQQMFDRKYKVSLVNDRSEVELENTHEKP